MNTVSVRPSTVDGIKQLAKKMSREQQISHTAALDVASRHSGYENFVHAKRKLGNGEGFPRHRVYLSVHWRTPRDRTGEATATGLRAGREIFTVDLARPLIDIVAKHRVSRARGLHGFRMEYADHLEHVTNVQGQDDARQVLLTAARSLRFMEATGLQPVTTDKHRRALRVLDGMPGHDHASEWFDPLSDGALYLDEPYTPALQHALPARLRWLKDNGLQSVAPEWEGIYNPGACPPQLTSSDGALLQRANDSLAKCRPVKTLTVWPHDTGLCGDDFISPKRQADEKPRRSRPGPSWREHNGATPYGGAAGIASRWRPTKPMPFELHREIGTLMQSLCLGFSWRVHEKLSQARSHLEDWAITEHKAEHVDAVYDLYYGDRSEPLCGTDAERLRALAQARSIVERGYLDCKPRRNLLAALDAASAEVEKRQLG